MADWLNTAGVPSLYVDMGDSSFALRALGSRQVTTVTQSLARPDNANAYTIGDVINDATEKWLNFALVARAPGGSGRIATARLASGNNAVVAGAFSLWLFTAAPEANPVADHAVWGLTDAACLTCVAAVLFPAASRVVGNPGALVDGNSFYVVNPGVTFQCTAQNLIGVLRADSAYVPCALEAISVTLVVERD